MGSSQDGPKGKGVSYSGPNGTLSPVASRWPASPLYDPPLRFCFWRAVFGRLSHDIPIRSQWHFLFLGRHRSFTLHLRATHLLPPSTCSAPILEQTDFVIVSMLPWLTWFSLVPWCPPLPLSRFETINAISNPRFSLHYDTAAIFDHAHHHSKHFHTLFFIPFCVFCFAFCLFIPFW